MTPLPEDVAGVSAVAAAAAPWHDPALPPGARALLLIAAMNASERLVLLQGAPGPSIGNTAAIPRLGVPAVRLEDGPNGVADWATRVTTWPSSMTMAAAWDPALMHQYVAWHPRLPNATLPHPYPHHRGTGRRSGGSSGARETT